MPCQRLLSSTLLLLAGASIVVTSAAEPAPLIAPAGFTVSVFHEGVGQRARHLAVRDNGDVFVSMRDGRLIALRDSNGDGRADTREEREVAVTTELQIHGGHLYFSDDTSVSRVALDANLLPAGAASVVVSGFPEQSSHASKTFVINPAGELFVNVGAPSNACQLQLRTPGSPGMDPCPQLERQAAIWRYRATTLNQDQLDGERFVTGTRNVVALDWHSQARGLYFVIHGRDQLNTLWPALFNDVDSAEMPAEEFHVAVKGANYGWPDSFVDPRTGRRLIAPEYGGDGVTETAEGLYATPLHAYPAHWAPNDLLFYTGTSYPSDYRGGAFIAWQGSWNRSPHPQEGYRVTFQAMIDGAPDGEPRDFLLGFKGAEVLQRPSDARHRPGGLAQGPDGALYVTEAVEGIVWKVTYTADNPD